MTMSVTTDEANPDGSVLWYWYDNYHDNGKESTRKTSRDAIKRFERWLATEGEYKHECHWSDIDLENVSSGKMINPREVTEDEAEAFLHDLQAQFSPDTQQTTAAFLSQAYAWCRRETEPVKDDPFGYVLNTLNKNILDSPSGRDAYIIPIEDARIYIRSWGHPKWTTINLLLAKLSRRAGGISNLDIEDVNLDHPGCDWTPHPDVRHWDDHILFRADKKAREEGRKSGNKTATTAKYPLDRELRDALIWYLAIRPDPESPDEPLFLDTFYTRLSAAGISDMIRRKSKTLTEMDDDECQLTCWYGPHDDDNINPHYWRHWATTWYQDQLESESLTDYMRGDTGGGSRAIYDQYTATKKRKILKAMPTFLESYAEKKE
ncbi:MULTISPECIES: hypothetical protein [Halobacterium]|uniref:tyrosine-type recombinase/integrase n=1 Tax=Halobacterium TaxID=2239 RepID=UPI0012F765B0|nr:MULTISPECIES: hypothetical protein [Halobacterium]MCG1004801.1 hypothetical protein [Halobacterium noricense]